ncbi:hypothetical protein C8F04DRAFT_984785 [Mycena alexandri]|uniref:Uncharacterized protein n=1 Tax=Mycena alexandri TaxID=1745969 RepID=A0AAD6RVX3_9AGAR|nr:hypothetical protein C8F04DRAFT_984785 [Mycena alexandri]
MGIITALSLSNPLDPSSTLYTDHLNSVRLIDDSKTAVDQQTRLRGMNGRSYYRWILALANANPLTIGTRQAIPPKVSLPARMNFEADHYASHAQRHIHDVPTAPIPTFFRDDYTFYTRDDGWIESNVRDYVAKSQIRHAATLAAPVTTSGWHSNSTTLNPRPNTPTPHAYSAYSAVVQLYARSGQLPTADILYSRGKIPSPLCRLGCNAIEDQHHIFVDCPRYAAWRTTTSNELATRTNNKLAEKGIEEVDRVDLLAAAKSLFSETHLYGRSSTLLIF